MNNPIDTRGSFDSRDLIEYKEYLEDEIYNNYISWVEDCNEYKEEDAEDLEIPENFESIEFLDEEVFTQTCEDLLKEYNNIVDFCDELDYGDFEYGETIISEEYFTEYCEDLVEQCGYISKDLPSFISNNIDWDAVADDLRGDYTEADYDGITYLMRS